MLRRVIFYTLSFKQNQKEHTNKDYSIKEGIVIYNSLLYYVAIVELSFAFEG